MWVFRNLCGRSLIPGEVGNLQSYPEAWFWCQVGGWALSPFLLLTDSSAPCSSLQLAVPCSLSAHQALQPSVPLKNWP